MTRALIPSSRIVTSYDHSLNIANPDFIATSPVDNFRGFSLLWRLRLKHSEESLGEWTFAFVFIGGSGTSYIVQVL